MDIATIVGILSATGLVLGAIFMGSGLNVFINIPALCIVVGGTIGVTLIAYPLKDFLSVIKVVQKALFSKKYISYRTHIQVYGFCQQNP